MQHAAPMITRHCSVITIHDRAKPKLTSDEATVRPGDGLGLGVGELIGAVVVEEPCCKRRAPS